MMKKLLSLTLLFLGGSIAFAQTIVSTTPENKNVILEEFTGINCVYCPDGHAIANSIKNSYPDDVFLINVHVGGFATPSGSQPDFRTPYGTAIANQTALTGYPSGTVNRHFFSGQSMGGGTAMSRGQWPNAADQMLEAPSYLNMAVEAEIDFAASELTVHVEGYYTDDSPEATNKLNVALLQNNTLGPQTGGNMGNNYVHMHRLVEMITGQWGEDIATTSQGDFVDKTYTYSIPADYNGVPVVLEDLEVVAFMTETTQEIISGSGAYPLFTNLPFNNNAAISADDFEYSDQCGVDFAPTVKIQNRGNNPLTSLDIDYSINGGTVYTYNWTGNLLGYQSEEVTLDAIPYSVQASNTVSFEIPNDEEMSNNTSSNSFGEVTDEFTNSYALRILCDENGDEITWSIVDETNTVVQSGGPYAPDEDVNITFNLEATGCHKFVLLDSGNDGGYYIKLTDSENNAVYFSAANFGSKIEESFKTNGVLGVEDNFTNQIAVFPNPATSRLNIVNAENATVEMYDITGRVVLSQSNIAAQQEIEVSRFVAGTYFVRIAKGDQVKVEKVIIAK